MASRIVRTTLVVALAACFTVSTASPAAAEDVPAQQWHHDYLQLEEVHELSHGEGVTVGMIDSGVDAQHPDLEGVVREGAVFGEAEDSLEDPENHGTGVASVLAGRGVGDDDSSGVLGVAPEAELVSVVVTATGENAHYRSLWMGEAIQYLVDEGVDVISISMSTDYHELGEEAVQNAREAEIPVVAGAGNIINDDGSVIDTRRSQYPANYPGAVGVTGIDEDGGFWEGSVKSWAESDPNDFTVAAPAENIPVATPGGGYELGDGTSLAAPIVAGTYALIKARWPDLGWADTVNQILLNGTTGVDEGEVTDELGYGIVDPLQAMTTDIPDQTPEENPDDADEDGASDDGTTLTADSAGSVDGTTMLAAGAAAVVLTAAGTLAFLLWRYRGKPAPTAGPAVAGPAAGGPAPPGHSPPPPTSSPPGNRPPS